MDIQSESTNQKRIPRGLIYDILFVVVLLVAAYFRFTGLDWDEGTYLHPDERFLAMVETSIEPVGSFGEYWDTQLSSLNPNNRGHGFFVYGTLPIFFVRYVMEWAGQVGYGEVANFGRPLAGLFDLLTICMLYLAASRLYDRRVGLFAAAFSGFAVLQIQLSHFYTVDIFANFFIWFAIFAAVRIVKTSPVSLDFSSLAAMDRTGQIREVLRLTGSHPLLRPFIIFGILTGAAAASKISAFPVAFLLPLAAWIYLSQYSSGDRSPASVPVALLLVVGGFLAATTFRIFQPYAFSGPGLFGVLPNPHWLETIGRLQELVEPSSGFPPSVQWFDRPIWFSGLNLTIWGLGLPLGLLAWAGFAWMGYRILRGDWQKHILVWGWVGFHFAWQSSVPNPTMRYQLPIYPGMALMAAWGIVHLWDRAKTFRINRVIARSAVFALGGFVLVATFLYAAAFSGIYRRPVTRIEASRWLFQNAPGALNIRLQTAEGLMNQPLPIPNGRLIRPGDPFSTAFVARESGILAEILVPHIEPAVEGENQGSLYLSIAADSPNGPQVTSALINIDFSTPQDVYNFDFGEFVSLEARKTYYLSFNLIGNTGSLKLCDDLPLLFMAESGPVNVTLTAPEACIVTGVEGVSIAFTPEENGYLPNVVLSQPLNYSPDFNSQTISVVIGEAAESGRMASGSVGILGPSDNVVFTLNEPMAIEADQTYVVQLIVETGSPVLAYGSVLAQETSWDDPLPMRVDGYDGFGGIYRGDNNQEMYWDDNPEKLDRITGVLDNVDIIPISSSRQWGSLTRLPERWPLVDRYYRLLMGCPDDRTVEWCYNVAQPGMFEGKLGFELVQVFQSNPKFGFFEVNDQFSEEAFTVYDHPKVFILVKTDEYDPALVRSYFDGVLTGATANAGQESKKPLLLSEEDMDAQKQSGGWSALFNSDSLLNRFQPLAVIVWYSAVFIVGLAVYPGLRNLLPGLEDRGYPLARTAGLLLVSYITWILGSAGLVVSRGLISLVIAGLLALGVWLGLKQREQLLREWRLKKNYFLTIEIFAAALFLFVLFIRIGNPDLWHPWKGGEKPMDFAYFNAVLRSINFPPYDPWFSGGYINYYYYGFVFVGVLVKWLGIVPSIAYNLLIPTLFMMVGLGAFSITWNLVKTSLRGVRFPGIAGIYLRPAGEVDAEGKTASRPRAINSTLLAYYAGMASAFGIALMGNLGTLRMIVQGYQRIAAPPETVLSETFFLTRWLWTFQGLFKMLSTSAEFPYAMADWYWNPSRAIPAPGDIEPITEFPFFTFLYADLHAHMIAMPIALLALAWSLSVVLAKGTWRSRAAGVGGYVFGGMVIGALRPTNTWDFPTYLVLGLIAVFIGGWRSYGGAIAARFDSVRRIWPLRLLGGLAAMGALGLFAWFLYEPYTQSYALGYSDVNIWEGGHTELSAYLTHWGLFVFLILFWMSWETREWLASTPAYEGLRFLRSKIEYILGSAFFLLAAISLLMYLDVHLGVFVLPAAAWAGVLMFRPGQSDQKRTVLFLIGTGFFLTLMVEVIVLSGDIGRMNTVFKFYLQVWLLFGVAASTIVGWTLSEMKRWNTTWRSVWRFGLIVLAFSAFLYPLLGGFAKIEDRMTENAPITLDGMAYMPFASYYDQGRELRLDEDYRAIRWMQENIDGTPVIVEGQVVEYRWGSRYSIYTGLPSVLGWNWHQRQQRTGHDLDVWDRSNRIQEFYATTNVNIANRFLSDYDVDYIVVGQMEQAYYSDGLDKFDIFNGRYWQEVYRDGETRIYRVIPQEAGAN